MQKSNTDVKEEEDMSDEIMILNSKKALNVSLRKSIRVQNLKIEERKRLQQLEDQRGKKLAAKFVITKASVTYSPPTGYYGGFGVCEKRVEGQSDSPDIDLIEIDNDEQDDMIEDAISNKHRPPKKTENWLHQ